ncbi:MAG: hypothetical protein R3B97_00205 [Dehalococcoidia bacterium]|nr:hypothetical protein [Dehalococcoidia bacterium]MCB9485359.1 hypothetical protein [Thermoflexaceae bacterium]
MLFELIFLSLFITGWVVCGYLPWFLLSVFTRGNAGLVYLPLSVFTGVVAGLAVPLLGPRDVLGLWLSMAFAFLAPSVLLALRRFSLAPVSSQPRTEHRPE